MMKKGLYVRLAAKKMFAGGTLSLIMRYGTVIVGIFVFAFLM